MTQKKKRIWPKILLGILVLLAGVVVYFVIYPSKLARVILPDFSKVEQVDALIRNDSLHLNARGVFVSESIFPLVVDSLFYRFYVEDSVLYQTRKKIDLSLSPGESDTVNISVHVPFQRIRNISKHIKPMDSVMIGVKCEVVYKYFGRHIRLEFKKEGKILRPVPPKIKLMGLGKKDISDWGKSLDTEAELLVVNEGKKLNVTVTELEYDIVVGDKITGHGRYNRPITLKPGKSLLVRIPVSLDISEPLKVAYALLFKKESVNYRLDASAMVDFHSKKKPNKIKVYLTTMGDTRFSAKGNK